MSATSPKLGFAHHRDPTARPGRQREGIVTDNDRPTFLFDSNPGDDESDAASDDLRRDTGDWLERRMDLPRTPTQPSSRLWPLLTPKNPLNPFRRLPRVAGVSDLMSTERGLRIFPEPPPLTAIELEGSPIPTEAQDNGNDSQEDVDEDQILQPIGSAGMDEDETALVAAIELSLRTQNRYTANGTNLEELHRALANSVL